MGLSNTLIAIDLVMKLLEASTKIQSMLAKAVAENRNITDEELLAIQLTNDKKTKDLIELIKTKLGK